MKKLSYLFAFLFLGLGWASPSRGEPAQLQNVDLQAIPSVYVDGIKYICNMDQSTVYLYAKVTAIDESKDFVDFVGECGTKNKFNLRIHRDVFKEGGILAKEGDKITLNQVTGQKVSSTMDGPDDDAISMITFESVNLDLAKRNDTDMTFKLAYSPKITSSNEDLAVTVDAVAASKAMVDANAPSAPSTTGQTSPVQPAAGPVATSKAEGGCSLISSSESMYSYFSHLIGMLAGAGVLGLKTLRKRSPSK